jgi:hypothetical protein
VWLTTAFAIAEVFGLLNLDHISCGVGILPAFESSFWRSLLNVADEQRAKTPCLQTGVSHRMRLYLQTGERQMPIDLTKRSWFVIAKPADSLANCV